MTETHIHVIAAGGPRPSIVSDHAAWLATGEPCLLCGVSHNGTVKEESTVAYDTTYCYCGHAFEQHDVWREPDGTEDAMCNGCLDERKDHAEHTFDEDAERTA